MTVCPSCGNDTWEITGWGLPICLECGFRGIQVATRQDVENIKECVQIVKEDRKDKCNKCPNEGSYICDECSNDPNNGIVTGVNGGKQSKINTSFSLVPHKALLAIGKVMAEGAKKYPKDNWRKLTPDEIYDHTMEHLINWKITGDMEELEHAVTRASMLYEVVVDMERKLEQMY